MNSVNYQLANGKISPFNHCSDMPLPGFQVSKGVIHLGSLESAKQTALLSWVNQILVCGC